MENFPFSYNLFTIRHVLKFILYLLQIIFSLFLKKQKDIVLTLLLLKKEMKFWGVIGILKRRKFIQIIKKEFQFH